MDSMREELRGLDIQLIGLCDIPVAIPDVEEVGNSPLENACLKAKAYYQATGMAVFSCDSGLYIEGLADNLQPGVNVRTVGGRRLSDDEMIDYYANLAQSLGGQAVARYHNAICLVVDNNTVYAQFDESLASNRFLLTSIPHQKRQAGFPLDSLSVEIKTGKYYYDLEDLDHTENDQSKKQGFRAFFRKVLDTISVGDRQAEKE
jgi:XTP/dITP diphosphohydrolase